MKFSQKIQYIILKGIGIVSGELSASGRLQNPAIPCENHSSKVNAMTKSGCLFTAHKCSSSSGHISHIWRAVHAAIQTPGRSPLGLY